MDYLVRFGSVYDPIWDVHILVLRCLLSGLSATSFGIDFRTGLDYRLTYEHPTKGKITICPITMRKQLLQERAAWRGA